MGRRIIGKKQLIKALITINAVPNKPFNPTARSVPLINLVSCDITLVLASDGGLIRALCGCQFWKVELNGKDAHNR